MSVGALLALSAETLPGTLRTPALRRGEETAGFGGVARRLARLLGLCEAMNESAGTLDAVDLVQDVGGVLVRHVLVDGGTMMVHGAMQSVRFLTLSVIASISSMTPLWSSHLRGVWPRGAACGPCSSSVFRRGTAFPAAVSPAFVQLGLTDDESIDVGLEPRTSRQMRRWWP